MPKDISSKKIDIRIIQIIMSICLIAMFFIPFITITFNGTTLADPKNDESMSLIKLIVEGNSFTPVNNLGMFNDINFFNPLYILLFSILFAIVMIIVALAKKKCLRKWMYNIGIMLFFVIPIYAVSIINSSISVIQEVSKYEFSTGIYLSIILGCLFAYFSNKVDFYNDDKDSYLENKEKVRLLYILGSIAVLVTMFLPMIGIDFKTGLSSYKTYYYSFSNILLISEDINIRVLFTVFEENINLGALSVFWLIPITSIATIIFASLKNDRLVKILAFIQGALSVISVILIITVLKDNYVLFEGVKRIFTGYGAVILIATGVMLLIVLAMNRFDQPIPDIIKRTRINHRFAYIILGVLGLILYILPQAGISAKALNELALMEVEAVKELKILFNQMQIADLTNNFVTYLGYLIPVGIIAMFLFLVINKHKIVKFLALLNGVLLFITPLINRSVLNSILEGIEVAQFRITYVITMLIGAIFILMFYTDRDNKEQIVSASDKANNVFQSALLILFAVVQLYPLIWLFLASFMSEKEMFSGKVLQLPDVWHIEYYSKVLFGTRADETIMESIQRITGSTDSAAILKFITGNTADGNIVRYFGNSLFVVGITIVIVLVCSAMVSYALTRIEWKGNKLMYGFFTLGMMIPVHVALAPLYVRFAEMGILGTLWSLIIPYAGFGLSFAIIVLSGFMESIPVSLEEAATIDGCGRFGIFTKIILPMLTPSLATVTIFTFLGAWNELMFASVFINKGINRTITVGINHLATAQYNTEYGLIFAGLVVASLPTLIFYLIASDQVQKSLVTGSVKE